MVRLTGFFIKSVILGLAAAFVVLWLRPDLLGLQRADGASSPPSTTPGPASYAEAVNRAAPSVVSVYTRTHVLEPLGLRFTDPMMRSLYSNRMVRRPRTALGSGVIVSPDGYILTAQHVIDEVDDILVALYDGRFTEARVVGTDAVTDLAVLKINLHDLPAAYLAENNESQTGDVVLAIGNAMGLNHTVTMGIVSATGRQEMGAVGFEELIQTDAAINQGNSGGALVNPAGEVVGINRLNTRDGEGISFAVPADLARHVMNQIIEHGQVRRAWLGASLADLPVAMGVAGQGIRGVEVTDVVRGGPAWQSGLQPGDILTLADGQPVRSARQFLRAVAEGAPGDVIELEAVRDGQAYATSVTLIPQPQSRS